MTGKNTTTPATPAVTPSGVPVRLRSPAVIGNIDFAAGATVTVPPDTADWLVANGTAVIIDAPNAEEAATPKRRTPDR
ncbi:DUF7210 family protein [Cardiobacterium hominis]|uniref:DUF7210 family protein n=1 Tax=Cardiobacterium hominis TaxID=2718 RepID=UPI00206792EF|nr:hypothetical protein [Cardiobacterium hominis]DAF41606.1 MAG TPA: hypothetical protein [Caudoviricetes sp.]